VNQSKRSLINNGNFRKISSKYIKFKGGKKRSSKKTRRKKYSTHKCGRNSSILKGKNWEIRRGKRIIT